MKRITFLLLLFFVILCGATWFVLSKGDISVSFESSDRNFAIEDINEVYEIRIQKQEEEANVLRKKGNDWIVNDKYKVSDNYMANLKNALADVEMLFIPHKNANNNIISTIDKSGIHVQLKDKKGSILKSYFVGGSTPDERGIYYLMEDSKQPYVVGLPSMVGTIRARFNLSEIDMRDRTIITDKMKDIQSIKVEYPKTTLASFELTDIHGTPSIKQIGSLRNVSTTTDINASSLEAYLHDFTIGGYENFIGDHPLRDSISRLEPFARIKYTLKTGEEKSLKLYPYDDIVKKENTDSLEDLYDISRFIIDCSWGEFLLVQQRVFGNRLRPYDFFINKP